MHFGDSDGKKKMKNHYKYIMQIDWKDGGDTVNRGVFIVGRHMFLHGRTESYIRIQLNYHRNPDVGGVSI